MKPQNPQQSLFAAADTGTFGSRKPGRGAVFSRCRRYRFLLWERWSADPHMVLCGVNPSNADEEMDDHTSKRVIYYGKRERCGAVYIVNPFALIATDPLVMKAHPHPIEPQDEAGRCDRTILEAIEGACMFVAAWGLHGEHMGRDEEMLRLVRGKVRIACFGTTKDGFPKHPSRLGNNVPLIDYTGRIQGHG